VDENMFQCVHRSRIQPSVEEIFLGNKENRSSKVQEGEQWKYSREEVPRIFTEFSGQDSFQEEMNNSGP
jgi:hypothetical protein